MKIAVNAISIKEGGSAVVLERLLEEFVTQQPEHEYHVIINTRLPDFHALRHPSVRLHRFPWAERNFLATAAWYMSALPRWLKRLGIGILFSQTNYLPRGAATRTVLLLQNASYFCANFHNVRRVLLHRRIAAWAKAIWVNRSLTKADCVTVQTAAFADMIVAARPDLSGKLRIIAHGAGFLRGNEGSASTPDKGGRLQLLYVCKYGEQKNFAVVFRAMRVLRDEGVDAKLVLTLDVNNTGTAAVMSLAQDSGVADRVTNRGDVARDEIVRLYRTSHIFVFPSVCESFGFPLVEAMAMGLPVVAADVLGNRELCGDAALYFSAHDECQLAIVIQRIAEDPGVWAQLSTLGRQQAQKFQWTAAGASTLALLLREQKIPMHAANA